MLTLIGKRLLFAIPSLIGVVIVTFLLTRALPGDPAAYFAGPAATKEAVDQIRKKLGFSFLCVAVIILGYLITIPLYSLVKNIAYTDLPFPEGHRIVVIEQIELPSGSGTAGDRFDAFQFAAINERSSSFEQIGAFFDTTVNLSDGEIAEQYFASKNCCLISFSSKKLNTNASFFTNNRLIRLKISGPDI